MVLVGGGARRGRGGVDVAINYSAASKRAKFGITASSSSGGGGGIVVGSFRHETT